MFSFEINLHNPQTPKVEWQQDFSSCEIGVVRVWLWFFYVHIGF